MPRSHVHSFYRWVFGSRVITRWRCSCGLKVRDISDVKALEGRSE